MQDATLPRLSCSGTAGGERTLKSSGNIFASFPSPLRAPHLWPHKQQRLNIPALIRLRKTWDEAATSIRSDGKEEGNGEKP